jgi:hypothetical protein
VIFWRIWTKTASVEISAVFWNNQTARLVAQLDIGVQFVPSPTFFQYRLNQVMIGDLIMHWHDTIHLEGAFQRPSAMMLSAAMRNVAQEAFQSRLDTLSKIYGS